MNTVIKVEHLSKAYQLGQFNTGTLSQDLNRWWARVRGKEDPFLKVGERNDRSVKGTSNVVWSLKGIDLDIQEGDAVGIVGKNGAGKSTLLKILSRVTSPTEGSVKIKGRIASLLEVGTGFHPELSGRENIFLNGAILGMRRKEIERKFDEIVDFSGVERYIDTPVKRYSSGMYVRLAFAVAAHLESEILIVDEVLAVGDAEFQKKCMGKMQQVSKGEGRTVLFVSHNLNAVRQLCKTGVYLRDGELISVGTSEETVVQYLSFHQKKGLSDRYVKQAVEGKDLELTAAEITDGDGAHRNQFEISDAIIVHLTVRCERKVPSVYGYIVVKNRQEEVLIESDTNDILPNPLDMMEIGVNQYRIVIRPNTLPHGDYLLYVSFASSFSNSYNVDVPGEVLNFTVVDTLTYRGQTRRAKTSTLLQWEPTHAE